MCSGIDKQQLPPTVVYRKPDIRNIRSIYGPEDIVFAIAIRGEGIGDADLWDDVDGKCFLSRTTLVGTHNSDLPNRSFVYLCE